MLNIPEYPIPIQVFLIFMNFPYSHLDLLIGRKYCKSRKVFTLLRETELGSSSRWVSHLIPNRPLNSSNHRIWDSWGGPGISAGDQVLVQFHYTPILKVAICFPILFFLLFWNPYKLYLENITTRLLHHHRQQSQLILPLSLIPTSRLVSDRPTRIRGTCIKKLCKFFLLVSPTIFIFLHKHFSTLAHFISIRFRIAQF